MMTTILFDHNNTNHYVVVYNQQHNVVTVSEDITIDYDLNAARMPVVKLLDNGKILIKTNPTGINERLIMFMALQAVCYLGIRNVRITCVDKPKDVKFTEADFAPMTCMITVLDCNQYATSYKVAMFDKAKLKNELNKMSDENRNVLLTLIENNANFAMELVDPN